MLDNSTNDFKVDKAFMDKAWEEMSGLLDEAMPVEKPAKKRRWLFLLLFLCIGFTGGVGAMWWLTHASSTAPVKEYQPDTPKNTPKAFEAKPARPIAAAMPTDQEPQSDLDSEMIKATIISNPAIDVKNNNILKGEKKLASEHGAPAISSNGNQPAYTIGKPSVFVREVSIASMQPAAIMARQPADDKNTYSNTEMNNVFFTIADSKLLKQVESAVPVAALPLMQPDLPNASTYPAPEFVTMPTIKPIAAKWQKGVSVNLLATSKPVSGGDAQFVLERSIGKKWHFQTGLGYRAIKYDKDKMLEKSRSVAEAERVMQDDNGVNIGSGSELSEPIEADAAYAENYIATTNDWEHQLTVPAILSYHPTGKLRLMAGLNFALRLNPTK